MEKYWKYFKYVIRHKWYVLIECFKKGQYWRGITHDLSKFLPDEFIPYAKYFYAEDRYLTCLNCSKCSEDCLCVLNGAGVGDGSSARNIDNGRCNYFLSVGNRNIYEEKFNEAWLKHIHRNKHHWQYWLLQEDDGELKKIEMEGKFVDEMISDWNGAGLAINGVNNTREWYKKNKDKIKLNPRTRHVVETCINA